MATLNVVTPANLGADFDVAGLQVANKINIVAATTAILGKVRLASASDLTNGTAGAAVDAAGLKTQLANLVGALVYRGTYNAATNTPALVSGTGATGAFYKVSTGSVAIPATVTAAVNSGSTTIPVASTTGLIVGQQFVGGGAPANALITGISGSNVTISQATTANIANGGAVTFNSYLDGAGPFNVGDMVVFDGTAWDKLDGPAEAVTTVAGRIGAVTLAAADVAGVATPASVTAQASVLLVDAFGSTIGHALP